MKIFHQSTFQGLQFSFKIKIVQLVLVFVYWCVQYLE